MQACNFLGTIVSNMASLKPTVDNHVNQVKAIDSASSKRIEYLYSLLNELRYY